MPTSRCWPVAPGVLQAQVSAGVPSQQQAYAADGKSSGQSPAHLALHIAVGAALIKSVYLNRVFGYLIGIVKAVGLVAIFESLHGEGNASAQGSQAQRATQGEGFFDATPGGGGGRQGEAC